MDFPGYALGGLSLGEPKELTWETARRTLDYLPQDKPRYLMGVGSPEDVVEAVGLGIDMMDCVLPTRVARNGALFTHQGRVNIDTSSFREQDSRIERGCDCYTCTHFSAAYVSHLFRAQELLAYRLATIHNLRFMARLIDDIRGAILTGSFESFKKGFRIPDDERGRAAGAEAKMDKGPQAGDRLIAYPYSCWCIEEKEVAINIFMTTTFYIPTKIISGAGGFSQLGKETSPIGKKALLVTGKSSMRKSGLLDRAVADLQKHGVEVTVFDKIESNPRSSTVDEGAGIVRENKLEVVIALGGGSVMDASKGIVISSIGGKPIWHYIETRRKICGDVPRLITVPTVAASGSESNCGAVITNWETHDKCVVSDRCAYPAISIVDPELMLTLPAKPTAQGGVDIFCHLVEPYITAGNPQPLTDGIVETAMKIVVGYLPCALAKLDDLDARSQLSWASTVACSAFAGLGGGDGAMTMHGIEHPLSGLYDMAHGDGLAALLPAWLRSLADISQDRLDKLAHNVFGEKDGITAVEEWLKTCSMNHKLRDLGLEKAKLKDLAANALKTAPWLAAHPKKLDAAAIAAIYREAW